ncbi:hypothetical protein A8B84_19330 [Marinobacter sp. EhC06]|uniref:MarR family transcriptional regulator n=1 Tax=Marinobacter TaxID=2742 RepID=UPI0007DA3E90|nr:MULTISPECIES: MarR family transcriptional regulator [unclassified Marinobacter]OAN92565.1 hypothetical protein A8B80_00210 [Marinobacter sp. EhN04]OAN95116.1 hypothetical protein A8B84_19330 [Marinobacter sp. EhC06]
MSKDGEEEKFFVASRPTQLLFGEVVESAEPLNSLSHLVESLRQLDDKLSLHSIAVLIELARHQSLSQTELGELTRIRQSNLSRLLTHLGKGRPDQKGLGLVLSRVDEYNQRSKRFYLSKKGLSIIHDWRNLLTKQEN